MSIIEDTVNTMVEKDLTAVVNPPPPAPPTMTADKVKEVVACLRRPTAYGGKTGIAQRLGVTTGQVDQVEDARRMRLIVLSAEPMEPK